jgi:hypothetical protein
MLDRFMLTLRLAVELRTDQPTLCEHELARMFLDQKLKAIEAPMRGWLDTGEWADYVTLDFRSATIEITEPT